MRPLYGALGREVASSTRRSGAQRQSVFTGRRGSEDDGASLILALVFLIVVSLITISIAGLTAADLRLTSNFSSAQSMTAAADGATEVAISYARYNFVGATLNSPAPCNPSQLINNQAVQAWCNTHWVPLAPATRTVIVSTCLASVMSGASCESSPLVQAIVVFDDYPASSSYSSCVPDVSTNTTCGSQMDLQSWAYNVVPPVVTSYYVTLPGPPPVVMPPNTSACNTTGASVTLTGTGFTPSSSIEFVSASNYGSNVVLQASNVTYVSPTSLTGTAPLTPSGSGSFYIEVTGLTGANAIGPSTLTPTWTC